MPNRILEAVCVVMHAGNGAKVIVPCDGGEHLRVSYLWGKVGVAFCDPDGKIQLPAPRGRGSRIAATAETMMGEGAAEPPLPIQMTLGDEFLGLGEDSRDNSDQ